MAIDDVDTTARYFERAAAGKGHDVIGLRAIDHRHGQTLDRALVIDPLVVPPVELLSLDCPVIGYVIDTHLQLAPRLAYSRYFDHLFNAQSDYMPDFHVLPHPSAHWLPLGCDPEVHFVPGLERTIDVAFVGKLGQPGSVRHCVLNRVLASFATNDWRRRYTPCEMGEIYSRAKIVFNKSINGDLNMRVFEALGSGALLVTDEIGNGLDQIGTAGVHFVTYKTVEEALDRVSFYLAHDAERERIARMGQELAFSRHTYAHRLAEMLDVVALNPDARAPARTADQRTEAVWRSELMRMTGTQIPGALALLVEGHLSRPVVANVTVGVARGIVRPLRQRLQAIRAVRSGVVK